MKKYILLLITVVVFSACVEEDSSSDEIEIEIMEEDCIVGDPCDDGNNLTINDVYNSDCECIGEEILVVEYGEFTDSRDGQNYPTVIIGDQEWLAKNLNYKFQPNIPVYWNCSPFCSEYGPLYHFYGIDQAIPPGWHLPTLEEWQVLFNNLGGPVVAGGKLKEGGVEHWNDPNVGATNESGFTALPGGQMVEQNGFIFIGFKGYFWTSTQDPYPGSSNRYMITIDSSFPGTQVHSNAVHKACSVRLVKD